MFLAREEIRASWITISAGRLTIGSFLGSKIDHNRNKQERVLFLVARKRLETIELNTMNGREDRQTQVLFCFCVPEKKTNSSASSKRNLDFFWPKRNLDRTR